MTPSPGERVQRFVGDRLLFHVRDRAGRGAPPGWRAMLRTNLGRAEVLRREIIQAHTRRLPIAGASWRDIPMRREAAGWSLELPLAETGYFLAKAYLVDPDGWQHWPPGPDLGISVHPDIYRSANTIYCAFARLFGPTKEARKTAGDGLESTTRTLDAAGWAAIPPSGKLRDLAKELPHIIEQLNCRIVHLLPVHPTPTTYARFGRFGSPYAALDLTAIDPALVEFDRRTTGIEQFRELTFAAHLRGARVVLDIVINHTGWGSVLQEGHPEWFLRNASGQFASPGAWGNTWEDLVELKHDNVALWDELADMFLTWCRRGVDGFRCDAGYMVPVAAWEYIITRVRQEYPDALFLLEGLGGAWEATETLLTRGGMQWAYSELFQNYSGHEVSSYVDHSLRQDRRTGLLVHYSETHDNPRLAAKGRGWSLLRNRLCALTSVSGGFGFSCGVEWLADEKIVVHGSTGMNWGSKENLVPELSRLNALLLENPCFYDGAIITRLSGPDSPILALHRQSAEGLDQVLVLVNTDAGQAHELALKSPPSGETSLLPQTVIEFSRWIDLLGQPPPDSSPDGGAVKFKLPPGAAFCLAPSPKPAGLHGEQYRQERARAAFGTQALCAVCPVEALGPVEWKFVAREVERSPEDFLTAITHASRALRKMGGAEPYTQADLARAIWLASERRIYPAVTRWTLPDVRRVMPVPAGQWLLVADSARFRAALARDDGSSVRNAESILAGGQHLVCFPPQEKPGHATLHLERYVSSETHVRAEILFLGVEPSSADHPGARPARAFQPTDLALLTNGRGGMARLCVDLGRVNSKYDCVLAANLHPDLPVDRHVFVKRVRFWINADGFISALNYQALNAFSPGPPATWDFVANAGDGRTVQVQIKAWMPPGRNTTIIEMSRPSAADASGKQLPETADVRLSVRVDIEDRSFHGETKRNGGAEHHFHTHMGVLSSPAGAEVRTGFAFTPAPERQLRVYANAGKYHPQPEWSENIPHPVEQTRGQVGAGDAFSPGWFDLPLAKGSCLQLVLTAERHSERSDPAAAQGPAAAASPSVKTSEDGFASSLRDAISAFVVRRGNGRTVIAGYPWFLDWGRDTFICARGLIAAGRLDEVRQMLLTFAKFEQDGTLPNTIFGEDATNRDTSDAPLWFALVCEELAAEVGSSLYEERTGPGTSTLWDTLSSIAVNYARGTPNGIRMDSDSGLIWSPAHFTWMDTNYPACTPREGYPVEIQVLWIRLLEQLSRVGGARLQLPCAELARKAANSLQRLFWLEERGYYADLIIAARGQPVERGQVDDALRSNCLIVVGLGLAPLDNGKRTVEAAKQQLVIPGGLRSLAPLPLAVPLPNQLHGRLLNDPHHPYWGRYEGDEDTRRKPAYHNGTVWTWTFPMFCEALVRAWEFSPEAVEAAQALLLSMEPLLGRGCLGQFPEVMDGDAPHTQRGCDAQAWAATEAFRVWQLLSERRRGSGDK